MTRTWAAVGAGGAVLALATLAAASTPREPGRAPAVTTRTVITEPTRSSSAPETSDATAFGPAYAHPISEVQWAKIRATGTWRPECPVGRTELTNVSVPFFGMDGMYHRGTITVNKAVARDTIRAFNALAAERFPFRQVVPIENLGGSDISSERADNTSGFNCRKPSEANSPMAASPHAHGRAIDINPWENPWIQPRTGAWEPDAYWTGSRRTLENEKYGLVVRGGTVHEVFTELGWLWAGESSSRDAMHFDTGYPSEPWPQR
jgi:hypothetical protein